MTLILASSIVSTAMSLKSSAASYSSLRNSIEHYENVYLLKVDGNYVLTFIAHSDEVFDTLNQSGKMIYTSPLYDIDRDDSLSAIANKIVFANEAFIRRQNLKSSKGEGIDGTLSNVVYTKDSNVVAVEDLKLKSQILCETGVVCHDTEIIVLDEVSDIEILTAETGLCDVSLEKDFVLVPQTKGMNILSMLFVFNSVDEAEFELLKLAQIIDLNAVSFVPVNDNLQRDYLIARNAFVENFANLLSNLIISLLVSLIYYQVVFNSRKKEMSIYWVNGLKFQRNFYYDFLYQLVLNLIALVFLKRLFLPELPLVFCLILWSLFAFYDYVALIISVRRFHKQLKFLIKERVL